jgi:hypothetical protein
VRSFVTFDHEFIQKKNFAHLKPFKYIFVVAAKVLVAEFTLCRVDRNCVLYQQRLTILVSIQADRTGAWFPALLGPYRTWFPGIYLALDFERKTHEKSVLFWCLLGVKFLRSLFAQIDSRIT